MVEVGWQVLKYIILFGTIMVNVCAVFYMRPLLYVISVGYVLIFLFPRRVDIPFPLVSDQEKGSVSVRFIEVQQS